MIFNVQPVVYKFSPVFNFQEALNREADNRIDTVILQLIVYFGRDRLKFCSYNFFFKVGEWLSAYKNM